MKRATIGQVVALAAMLFGSLGTTAMAQAGGMTVTLYEGESTDKKLNCNDPRTQTATMTVADAASITVANPAIAGATLVDPNGNNGKGSTIKTGQVESPTVRITGNKAGSTTVTIKLSCPVLFNPTHGIGMAKHQWTTVTITVIVLKRPDVPTEPGGGGKGGDGKGKGDDRQDGPNGFGGKGSQPTMGPDVPTYDPRFYEYKDGKLVPRPDAPRRGQSQPKSTGGVNQDISGAPLAGARIVLTGYVVEDQPASFSVLDSQGQTLAGVVVNVGDRQLTTDENGMATVTVSGSVITKQGDRKVLEASIAGARAAAMVLTGPFATSNRLILERVPQLVTQGNDVTISGRGMDPVASGNLVRIDRRQVAVLASSPVELKTGSRNLSTGKHEIELMNRNGVSRATTNVIGVRLTSTETVLPPGGEAVVTARVEGLRALPETLFPLQFGIVNHSIGNIAFKGVSGSVISHQISSGEVTRDGTFTYTTPIRAILPGAYQITAEVLPRLKDQGNQEPYDCSDSLDDAIKKREEAVQKRLQAAALDKEIAVLSDPAAAEERIKKLRIKAAKARKDAKDRKSIKHPATKGKEVYDAEAAGLEQEAIDADTEADEIQDLLDKFKDLKGADRRKTAADKKKQAKDLRDQADALVVEAKDLEDKCK